MYKHELLGYIVRTFLLLTLLLPDRPAGASFFYFWHNKKCKWCLFSKLCLALNAKLKLLSIKNFYKIANFNIAKYSNHQTYVLSCLRSFAIADSSTSITFSTHFSSYICWFYLLVNGRRESWYRNKNCLFSFVVELNHAPNLFRKILFSEQIWWSYAQP